MKIVTCTAPVNIAVIKYWGKRDEDLILPINDSISVTLCSNQMHAKTTVARSSQFQSDRIWLNGKEEDITNPRLANCLREVRRRANIPDSQCVHICSENNFPTAAGLASSAAGYACLVYALCKLFNLDEDCSELARLGSGSACRSVFGGFVQWHMGSEDHGRDSIATVIKEANHWPSMRVLILVVCDERKKVPSSVGMKLSVETSSLIHHRATNVVPERVARMKKAIEDQNFEAFARLTMEDSNQLHAICLDTFPPCVYMNQVSHAIVNLVHSFNKVSGSTKVCYTFDAGPNACLFLPETHVEAFVGLVQHYFPPEANHEGQFIRGEEVNPVAPTKELIDSLALEPLDSGSLRYVISTKVGDGPKVLEDTNNENSVHLLNSDGLPRTKIVNI